jgi:ABC-type sugar transport systems, permease components
MKYRIKDRLTGLAFLFPSVLSVFLFFLLPFCVVIGYSLIDSPLNGNFVALENFRALLHNGAFLLAAKNTLSFSALAVPLAVILSLLLAVLLDSRIPGKSLFRMIFLSPVMVPIASVVLIWQVIFHYNGALNELLLRLGLARVDWLKASGNQLVVVLLFLWKNLGYNMVLFLAALNNIPRDILEAASIDGAGAFRRFFRIKLRFLSPSILFVTILSLINSFKVFREVWLLVGDYPLEGMYMLQHFINNTFGRLEYDKLSSAAVLMSLGMMAVIGVLFLLENRFGKDVEN